MKFITQSGSVYEVNSDSKKIRRLSGVKDPTPRQGKDGEWRGYLGTFPDPIRVGSQVLIRWGNDTELLPETKEELAVTGGFAIPTSITSVVVSIEE